MRLAYRGVQNAIDWGLDFLSKGQEKDGSFFCLVSAKLDDYRNANVVPAIVPTNIVLSSLAHIVNSKAENIRKKAAKFLLGERGEYWSFNYWFKKSDWYKKEPYPDDTDDTFCALAALYEYDPKLFGGEVMAKIVTMLTSCEEKEGGPYDMWLVPPKARNKWRDIDLVCNSNIAYFLSLQDIHLPKLDAFIDKSIQEKDYEFPYNKIYPGIYFISRFYRGGLKKEMIKLILSKQGADGKWENPLRTALAISSLIHFEGLGHKKQLEKGVDYLIKTQNQNGGWEPYSFYFQMRTKKKTLYAGSPFITTALCLEAIQKYNTISNFKFLISKQIQNSKLESEIRIYKEVLKRYKQRFFGFSKDFQEKAIAMADKILTPLEVAASRSSRLATKSRVPLETGCSETVVVTPLIERSLTGRARLLTGLKKNKDIILLPYYFASSLHQNRNSKFVIHNSDLLIRLGEANLCGWIAYTIYDDFLDEEGDPKELPLANVCLRESAEIFGAALPQVTGFSVFSKKIFDVIDDVNMWEMTRCRAKFPISHFPFSNFTIPDYGDYSQLANKSLGHALGPVAILFALGYRAHSMEVINTMRFFKNYIIARQINDDAHDWEDDLKRGQVNAVGARLLKDARPVMSRRGGTTTGAKSNKRNLEILRQIFWHKTILGACKDILRHVKFAQKDLKKLSLIKEPEFFIEMLAAIERSAKKALEEREETMQFLQAYSSRKSS